MVVAGPLSRFSDRFLLVAGWKSAPLSGSIAAGLDNHVFRGDELATETPHPPPSRMDNNPMPSCIIQWDADDLLQRSGPVLAHAADAGEEAACGLHITTSALAKILAHSGQESPAGGGASAVDSSAPGQGSSTAGTCYVILTT